MRYWLPTIPYTVIDAINRHAAATGSMRYAAMAADSNYNGHDVSVCFNEFRGYWITEDYWAGRRVHARGSVDVALQAGKREYARGAKGCVVRTGELSGEAAKTAEALGYVEWSSEIEVSHLATWYTALHAEVGQAARMEQSGLGSHTAWLANSKNLEEYKATCEAYKVASKSAKWTRF